MPRIEILDNINLLQKTSQIFEKNKESNLFISSKAPDRQTLCLLGPLEVFGEDELFSKNLRCSKAEIKSNNALIYEISVKKLIKNVSKKQISDIQQINKIRLQWRRKILKNSENVNNLFEKQCTQPFYQTKSKFKAPEEILDHINEKNKVTLEKLPLTFSFNYRNKEFFKGINKFYPTSSDINGKSEIEQAIFPDTTLIPFKKKLHALALGLRHFRISHELKEKLQAIVKENTEKNKEKLKAKEEFNLKDLFSEFEEIEEKDILAGFFNGKLENQKEITEKKLFKKKENPLVALSNNLNLKLFFKEKNQESSQEKELLEEKKLFANNRNDISPKIKEIHNMRENSRKMFFPNKKIIEDLLKKPKKPIFPQKGIDNKRISLINVSKVIEMESNEDKPSKLVRSFASMPKKTRRNLKEFRETGNEFLKNRKLVFLTEES